MSPGRGAEALQNYGPQLIAMLKAEFSNYHRKGELYLPEDGAIVVSLPTLNIFIITTGLTEGVSTGAGHVVLNGANGTITIGDQGEGLYKIYMSCSASANKVCTIHGAAFLNGTLIPQVEFRRDITRTNNIGNFGRLGYSPGVLVAGDVLDFRFSADVNTVNFTIDHLNFHITWSAGE